MDVRSVMTSDPVCCTRETPIQDVARMMVEQDCGQIPVVDSERDRRPVGVVTDRDIVCRTVARGENPLHLTAGQVMSEPAVTVRPEMDLEGCCRVMEENQIRRAVVEDERGRCCGIISLADIAQSAPERMTAEVVRTVSQPGTGPSRVSAI